jgi:hypothetical protein
MTRHVTGTVADYVAVGGCWKSPRYEPAPARARVASRPPAGGARCRAEEKQTLARRLGLHDAAFQ